MTINTPNDPFGTQVNDLTNGHDDPNRGPLDRADNALHGQDDPNRGTLDRAANFVTGGTGGISAATSGSSDSGYAGSSNANDSTYAASGGSSDTNFAASSGSSSSSYASTNTGGKASAVFDSQEDAQRAVAQLRSAGIDDSNLSLIAQSGRTTTTTAGDGEIVDEEHGSILRGILGGGALGAGLGIAALAIPGVGPLVAAGAIASSAIPGAAAIGAAVGAAAGTLNEVLNSHGVSEEDSAYYGDRVQQGGVFVSVDSSQSNVDSARAQEILYNAGGHSASSPRTM